MTLGEQLQQIREEAGLTIEDLSSITKIQAKYLGRLEDDEHDKLPSAVYIRGFIQKWATACNQDSEKFLLQFYRENKALIVKPGEERLSNITASSFIVTPKHILLVFFSIAIAGLAGFIIYQQNIFSNIPQIEVFSPQEFNSIVELDVILIEGRVDNTDSVSVNDNQIQTTSAGEFQYEYKLSPGLNTIIIKAQSSSGKTVETIRKILKL